ncbi:MAG: glycosyltransferase family 2 protein [Bacteroidetes bacterium]|nr:glycosyltransferase family 2 protein [Bacteroidota bacterium]
MKVTGFTFIRNAIRFDYPAVEAITSILPVCDEFIVIAGNSDDETKKLIQNIGSPKIKIFDSVWDDSLREGGKVLAVETNKAIEKISADSHWAFYIQADEVVHEKFLPSIQSSMEKWKDEKNVEGLLFGYRHFYGSYDYVGDSSKWYRNEVRVIRPASGIYSFRDAQGFQKNGRPLYVKKANAEMYHYGWVKPPSKQQEKQKYFHSLWHEDDWLKKNVGDRSEFDYSKIDSVARFEGSHPAVMQKRISEKNWTFDFDPAKKKMSLKSRMKIGFEKIFGFRVGEYRNYRMIS